MSVFVNGRLNLARRLLSLLAIAAAVSWSDISSAREYPVFFERDYETATKLNDLYRKLEAADTLLVLDSASEAIESGACREQMQTYTRLTDGIARIESKHLAGKPITATERQTHARLSAESQNQ